MSPSLPRRLTTLYPEIVSCCLCPRLRHHCESVAKTKRRAYLNESYWGKPIPGFGDPGARLMIVGLAPAAHGANRTGRIFTGDRSGDWLYRALHKAGFANQPHCSHRDDGLTLQDTYLTCVVKCAPPDNRPTPIEQKHCSSFLEAELDALSQVKVWVALGQIAFKALWTLLQKRSLHTSSRRQDFAHGAEILLTENRRLLVSYHPSQQNTFTGRLTEPMLDAVFGRARNLLS